MSSATDIGTACPSPEEIAAYIEGRLSQEERARVDAHLADCPDCYEIYLGAVEFQLEDEAATVVPFPERRRYLSQAAAVAAILALSVAGLFLYRAYSTAPVLQPEELTAAVARSPEGEGVWMGGVTRGEGEEEFLTDIAAFRAGTFLVDIRLALESGNREDALNALSRMIDLLQEIPFEGQTAEQYTRIHRALLDGLPPQEVLGQAAKAEAEIEQLFAEDAPFSFGQWAEAGRLAAISRNPAVFRDRKFRKFLDWQLRHGEPIAPEVQNELRQIQAALEPGELQANDFSLLKDRFEAILDVYFLPQLGA